MDRDELSPLKSVTEAPDMWSSDVDKPLDKAPRPNVAPLHPPEPVQHCGDLTVSTIVDPESQSTSSMPPIPDRKIGAAAVTSINVRDNLRPPMSSRQTNNVSALHSKPPLTNAPKSNFGKVSASPTGATAAGMSRPTGKTPTIRRVGSAAGQFTPSAAVGRGSRTPVGRSGSTASTLSRPHAPPLKHSALTSVKKAPPTNASFTMNESVMSFMPTGEVDADGNPLTKTEEERMRIEIDVAYCRAMHYQIMRAKLRRAAEAQSRDVVAQLGALWEETQRLRESAAEKRAEASDIRRQRELHLATKLGGASLLTDDENNLKEPKCNPNTPLAAPSTGHPPTLKRVRSKSNSAKKETSENSTDLRTVCELLAPTMKDLSLLAGSIDKRRHALPMKDVINGSSKQLIGALQFLEGALIDMPKMAKMAMGSVLSSEGETTQTAETINTFRESAQVLGRECLQTADALQVSGEMVCHALALDECSRLKSKSNDWVGKV